MYDRSMVLWYLGDMRGHGHRIGVLTHRAPTARMVVFDTLCWERGEDDDIGMGDFCSFSKKSQPCSRHPAMRRLNRLRARAISRRRARERERARARARAEAMKREERGPGLALGPRAPTAASDVGTRDVVGGQARRVAEREERDVAAAPHLQQPN